MTASEIIKELRAGCWLEQDSPDGAIFLRDHELGGFLRVDDMDTIREVLGRDELKVCVWHEGWDNEVNETGKKKWIWQQLLTISSCDNCKH